MVAPFLLRLEVNLWPAYAIALFSTLHDFVPDVDRLILHWCDLFILVAAWFTYGESYLAVTDRSQADILVVEGWIGRKGIRAALDEFEPGCY
jgi:hypothetical protein